MHTTGKRYIGRLCDSCGLPHTLHAGVDQYRDIGNWSDTDEFGYWYLCDDCKPTTEEESE